MLGKYPKRWFNIGGKKILLTNICRRITIPSDIKTKGRHLLYTIKDGERPDQISERLYDTPDYWWVILLLNDMLDPYGDWPMAEREIFNALEKSMGDEMYEIKHYVDRNGDITDPRPISYEEGLTIQEVINTRSLSPVTHLQDALMINDLKRNIKLVDPDYISSFDKALEKVINE